MSSTTIAAVDPNTRNGEQHAKTYKIWLQKMLLFKFGGVRISSSASTVIHKHTPISVTATETIKCNTLPYLMFLSSLVALGALKSVRADATPTTVLKSQCNAAAASSSGSKSSHLSDQPDRDVVTKEIVKRFVYERYDLSELDESSTPKKSAFIDLLSQYGVSVSDYEAAMTTDASKWSGGKKVSSNWKCTEHEYTNLVQTTDLKFASHANISSVGTQFPHLIGGSDALPGVIECITGVRSPEPTLLSSGV